MMVSWFIGTVFCRLKEGSVMLCPKERGSCSKPAAAFSRWPPAASQFPAVLSLLPFIGLLWNMVSSPWLSSCLFLTWQLLLLGENLEPKLRLLPFLSLLDVQLQSDTGSSLSELGVSLGLAWWLRRSLLVLGCFSQTHLTRALSIGCHRTNSDVVRHSNLHR